MNHEIDSSKDDIQIRERGWLLAVTSDFFPPQRLEQTVALNAGELHLVLLSGSTPLQTGCLSEALTSSALMALTGSAWLFYLCFFSPHSQNHHCD